VEQRAVAGVQSERVAAIDNLRVLLTVLVIAHHAGQPYGPTGGQWPIFNDDRAWVLGPFFSVNAAFFMGLFFLISGYFLPGAFERKGARRFIADRSLRLGVPVLATAALFALIGYGERGDGAPFLAWLAGELGTGNGIELGHMWFAAHLLLYALLYAAWRSVVHGVPLESGPPGHRQILGYALVLAGVTALVRLWYPIDRWERLWGIVPFEPAHLPQYVSLFVLGICAARGDWLRRMPASTGAIWLGVGLGAAALRYLYPLGREAGLPALIAGGGAGWGNGLWSVWEALICTGMCVGLPLVFRDQLGRQNALLRLLAAASYATYVVHLWPVIGVQFALAPLAAPPLVKFALVVLAGLPLSFAAGMLLRRLPGARHI
jgi:peptidoglycan/LPS O-acetylase OafA/YrhL